MTNYEEKKREYFCSNNITKIISRQLAISDSIDFGKILQGFERLALAEGRGRAIDVIDSWNTKCMTIAETNLLSKIRTAILVKAKEVTNEKEK